MYQSPISFIQKDIKYKIEDAVMKAVQKVGVTVDKEKLLHALMYDREQYEKGYKDGLIDAVKHGEWNETGDRGGRNYACGCCRFTFIVDTCMGEPMWNYCPNCGARMDGGENERSD